MLEWSTLWQPSKQAFGYTSLSTGTHTGKILVYVWCPGLNLQSFPGRCQGCAAAPRQPAPGWGIEIGPGARHCPKGIRFLLSHTFPTQSSEHILNADLFNKSPTKTWYLLLLHCGGTHSRQPHWGGAPSSILSFLGTYFLLSTLWGGLYLHIFWQAGFPLASEVRG